MPNGMKTKPSQEPGSASLFILRCVVWCRQWSHQINPIVLSESSTWKHPIYCTVHCQVDDPSVALHTAIPCAPVVELSFPAPNHPLLLLTHGFRNFSYERANEKARLACIQNYCLPAFSYHTANPVPENISGSHHIRQRSEQLLASTRIFLRGTRLLTLFLQAWR